MSIKEELNFLINTYKIRQMYLAERLGISQTTISRGLLGKIKNPRLDTHIGLKRGIRQIKKELAAGKLPSEAFKQRPGVRPKAPSWIVHTEGEGLFCLACDTPALGVSPDSPEGRKFVADHSRCPDPFPAMRKGRPAEAEVGA